MLPTEELRSSFAKVKVSALEAIGHGAPSREDPSFRRIFELNNVIGRLAAANPERRRALKELQNDVNLITVGLKSGSRKDVEEGILLTEDAVAALVGREAPV